MTIEIAVRIAGLHKLEIHHKNMHGLKTIINDFMYLKKVRKMIK